MDIVSTKDTFISVHLTTCFLLSSDHLPVLIGKKMSFIFCQPTRPPQFPAARHLACLKDGLPSNKELPDEIAIDMCVEKLSSDLLEALAVTSPKSRPNDESRPPISGRNTPETRLRQRQITRESVPKAVSHLQ